MLAKLKRQEGGITRGGRLVRSIDMVYEGDVIVLNLNDTSFLEPNPELSVLVVFENDSLVVFDKPAGMPVHPSIRNYQCSHSARAGEHNSPMCPRGRTRCRYPLQAYLM